MGSIMAVLLGSSPCGTLGSPVGGDKPGRVVLAVLDEVVRARVPGESYLLTG